jgi:hypothetical protein
VPTIIVKEEGDYCAGLRWQVPLKIMRASIMVFKIALLSKESLFDAIKLMSSECIEAEETYTLIPKSGKLFELLNLLKSNNIQYSTHFNLDDDQ